ncbi:MAG: PD-(D/E)XK nuclease family protein [Candidatus Parcubacteria bacterium]|nr:PD-(D/E)XK nuclease family protein [Candidatus Parcubacteria bacterium]
MTQYYNAQRSRNLYQPNAKESYRISRSKIDLFLSCPRCFYLDRCLGVGRPPGFPFSLNSAVDKLLKKEFDIHRIKHEPHPLMKAYKIDAVPFDHKDMEKWRDALSGGITYLHKPTNFLVTGGIDDVWINPKNELLIVDYKSTSKDEEVNLDAEWQISYKRQMEVYQWLFRKNDFIVSPTGYFVYCNGQTDKEAFDAKLEFDIKIIPYQGDDSWVENTLKDIHTCLNSGVIPLAHPDCDYCQYVKTVTQTEKKHG